MGYVFFRGGIFFPFQGSARKEGRREGRKEGRTDGRKKGRKEGLRCCQKRQQKQKSRTNTDLVSRLGVVRDLILIAVCCKGMKFAP